MAEKIVLKCATVRTDLVTSVAVDCVAVEDKLAMDATDTLEINFIILVFFHVTIVERFNLENSLYRFCLCHKNLYFIFNV